MKQTGEPRKRKAAFRILYALGVLAGAAILGGLPEIPREVRLGIGLGGYVGMITLLRSAMLAWRDDWDDLFALRGAKPAPRVGHWSDRVSSRPSATADVSRPRERFTRRSLRTIGLAAAGILGVAVARGQQTIFNIPSADVLDKGKIYVEEDILWRPSDPDFAVFTARGVYGFGAGIEGGINVGGFVTPGRSTPTATLALKWQPVKAGNFALTVGAHGLFFLRGSQDGDPAGQFYAHASYSFPTNTRVTAGGWVATNGYAAASDRRGGLFALEQKLNDHLTLAGDWFTGKNGIGYLSPGIVSAWGKWTIYAAYTLKNGDSKGNAALLELGYSF
jgi:hypothetical protein